MALSAQRVLRTQDTQRTDRGFTLFARGDSQWLVAMLDILVTYTLQHNRTYCQVSGDGVRAGMRLGCGVAVAAAEMPASDRICRYRACPICWRRSWWWCKMRPLRIGPLSASWNVMPLLLKKM
jgi:hypothetical protein